ncbi:gag-pol polyprotein [Tanacetum coccineum]
MLIFSKAPEFLWAEAIATACFTQNRSIVYTWHNKTPYKLIRGRKPNIQYFHVFGSLCYPTNDRDDRGKMKPKAGIEYYETSSQEVSDDSAANTTDNDHTSSSSSIVIDQDDAPQIVYSSDEQVATAPNSPVMHKVANEFIQEDVADFNGNMFHNAPQTPEFETKNHLLEQVIGDPSEPVMTRKRLQTDTEVCMYALTVSSIKPKNIKEAMLDHSWIESMQDELNQFKCLDVCHKVVRLGINPMIQPEPEDLPKDNPKLEIAILRCSNEVLAENRGLHLCQNSHVDVDIEKRHHGTSDAMHNLQPFEFSSNRNLLFVRSFHTLSSESHRVVDIE